MDDVTRTTWRLRCGLPAAVPSRQGPPRCDLSASKVKLLDTCALAYSLGKIEKIDDRPTAAKFRGILAHRVIEAVSRPRLLGQATGCPTEAELRAALDSVGVGFRSATIADAWEVLEPLADRLDLSNTIAVEENFVVDVPQDAVAGPAFKLGGAFDRLDAHHDVEAGGFVVHVHDYKSGSYVASVSELLADPQALFYVAAVAAGGWTGPVRVTFHYLGAEQPTTFLAPPGTARRGLGLAATKMAEIRARKATAEWPGTKGPHCVACDYRTSCPIYAGMARTPKPSETCVVPVGSDADLLREYDRNRTLAKLFKSHQDECGEALRSKLHLVDRVIGGGLRAQMTARQLTRLPDSLAVVAPAVAAATGIPESDVADRIAGVNERRLKVLLESLDGETWKRAKAALDDLREVYDSAAALDVRVLSGGF